MTTYAQNTENWEAWQLDYRFGLILIMPPEDVGDLINPLRRQHDPRSYASCPAHISLSDPLACEMTQALASEIQSILKDVKPFVLHFDRLQASENHPGVAYPIYPEEPMQALKKILHESRAFGDQAYGRRHIPPHMTIAEFITIEDSLKLCAELQETAPGGEFLCDRLEYIVPDEDFCFKREMTFLLGS